MDLTSSNTIYFNLATVVEWAARYYNTRRFMVAHYLAVLCIDARPKCNIADKNIDFQYLRQVAARGAQYFANIVHTKRSLFLYATQLDLPVFVHRQLAGHINDAIVHNGW